MTVSVMAEAASCQQAISVLVRCGVAQRTGAIAVDLMLYFAPSRANVFVKPMRPILAAL
jgi:hypothetical protein